MAKVAYVCLDPGVPVFGTKGSSYHCQAIIRQFLRRGHTVSVLATRLGAKCSQWKDKVDAHALAGNLERDPQQRETQLCQLNDAVAQTLDRLGPFDYVYERHALWSFAAMEYARGSQAAGMLEVNAPLVEEQRQYRQLHLEDTSHQARHRSLQAADSIIAVSEPLAKLLTPLVDDPRKVHVVPNGVDTERFARPATPSFEESWPKVIGFVGSFKPWHGVDGLLTAFAKLRRNGDAVELWMVGDGPERVSLQRLAAQSGPDVQHNIRWWGQVDRRDMPSVLHGMDIAAAPYPPIEPFYFSPLKIMEYMAASLPVVASGAGQIRTLIQHGHTGLLASPGSATSLYQQLHRLVHDPALGHRLGQSARQWIENHGDWSVVLERILSTVPLPASRI